MEKGKTNLISFLKLAAVAGNLLFILWVLYNAIDEHFSGTLPEKISAIILIGLLLVNSFLHLRNRINNNHIH
ncbi:MAG: hypothetical protein ABI405_13310 [Parafilimonas sp.]